MRDRRGWASIRFFIVGVSSLGMFFGTRIWIFQEFPAPAGESGWRHLSLPMELLPDRDLLLGWERFSCAGNKDGEPSGASIAAGSPETVETVPEVSESRIQLFGILGEGIDTVYCFFDAESSRWFRLSCGKSDHKSGFTLEESGRGPLLVDARNASSYLIDSENNRLTRLAEMEETDEDK